MNQYISKTILKIEKKKFKKKKDAKLELLYTLKIGSITFYSIKEQSNLKK